MTAAMRRRDEGNEGGNDEGMTVQQVGCDGSGLLSVPRRIPPSMTFEAVRVRVPVVRRRRLCCSDAKKWSKTGYGRFRHLLIRGGPAGGGCSPFVGCHGQTIVCKLL